MGTALVAVVLTHQISAQAHGLAGGLSAASEMAPSVRARVGQPLATAFGNTFWWAFGMTALALVPAMLLPRRAAAGRVDEPEALVET